MSRHSKLFKNILLGTVTVILFIVAGCGYTKEEKALMANYEKVAKENAVNYIEEKYGFTPEVKGTTVLKVDSGPVPDFTPNPTGMIKVHMSYNGYMFDVKISGEESTTEGVDDYQREEIAQAFTERLSDEMDIDIVSIDVRYTDDNLLEGVFTDVDSLLEELKDRNLISIVVKTMDDISEENVQDIAYDGVELLVVSCENQQCLDILSGFKYLNEQDYRKNFYRADYMCTKMREYALYMNGHVFRNEKGEVTYVDYAHKKVDEDMYFAYNRNGEPGDASITLASDMAPEWDWSKDAGKVDMLPTFTDPKKVSESYAIDFGEHPVVQVFIKESNRNAKDKAGRYVALQYVDENGKEVYTHIATSSVDEYYSFTLEKQDHMRFALMINDK